MRFIVYGCFIAGVIGLVLAARQGAIAFGPPSPRAVCARVCAPENISHVLVRVSESGDVQGFDCECGGIP